MRKEFHFSIVYALARLAGIPAEVSKIIANSSQYVDDHNHDFVLKFNTGELLKQIPTAYKTRQLLKLLPQNVSVEATVLFHFLPSDTKLTMRIESDIITDLILFAIRTKDPYLLGIILHVIADSYSHCEFKGVYDIYNRVRVIKGKNKLRFLLRYLLSIVPPIGHGMVGTLPDIPNITWGFKRGNIHIYISNLEMTLRAISYIYGILLQYSKAYYPNTRKEYNTDKIINIFNFILPTLPYNAHMCYKRMQDYIHSNYFNIVDFNDIDKTIEYDATSWFSESIKLHKPSTLLGLCSKFFNRVIYSYYTCEKKAYFESSNYFRFTSAASAYKRYVASKHLKDVILI